MSSYPPTSSRRVAVLDIEASGFGAGSYPIEVGYVLPDGAGACTLIRPEPQWTHWDPDAQAVHGISRATALRHGRPVTEVAQQLNDRLRGRTLYCDGWAHDYPWLALLFDAAGCTPLFRLDNLHSLLNEEQAGAWHATKLQVGRTLGLRRHRASSDARLLQLTLLSVGAAPAADPSAG